MSGNRAVTYQGPMKVAVENIDYPTFELKDGPGVNPANVGRRVDHGVILKSVATNICGSDQHMVRGRTTAPEGLILGHEITGEVAEVGFGEIGRLRDPALGRLRRALGVCDGAGALSPWPPRLTSVRPNRLTWSAWPPNRWSIWPPRPWSNFAAPRVVRYPGPS